MLSEHSELPLTQSQSEATTISTITSTITQTVAPSTTTIVTSTQYQTVDNPSPTETVTAYALPEGATFRIQAISLDVTDQFIGAPSPRLGPAYTFGSPGNSFSLDTSTGLGTFLYDNTLEIFAITDSPNIGEVGAGTSALSGSSSGTLVPASISTSNDAGPAQRCRFRAVEPISGVEFSRACGGTWYSGAYTSCSPVELYAVLA